MFERFFKRVVPYTEGSSDDPSRPLAFFDEGISEDTFKYVQALADGVYGQDRQR